MREPGESWSERNCSQKISISVLNHVDKQTVKRFKGYAISIYMKTFCKTKRKDLPLVLYSVIYLRPLILLIMRYFYGNWNISMGLEVYRTNFLLVICKTDSNILLLGGIGQLPGG